MPLDKSICNDCPRFLFYNIHNGNLDDALYCMNNGEMSVLTKWYSPECEYKNAEKLATLKDDEIDCVIGCSTTCPNVLYHILSDQNF